ncbi:hypothetical protein ACPV36_07300 [Photobacterium damselae]|uniref:hypothetical protein n=1 Tax=Photobacterium damselae TaxID=38293 RepID=UPI0040686E2D
MKYTKKQVNDIFNTLKQYNQVVEESNSSVVEFQDVFFEAVKGILSTIATINDKQGDIKEINDILANLNQLVNALDQINTASASITKTRDLYSKILNQLANGDDDV